MYAVRDWLCPFASFSVATTVYVWPFAGMNAGVNVTDWSAASVAVGWPTAIALPCAL